MIRKQEFQPLYLLIMQIFYPVHIIKEEIYTIHNTSTK